MALLKHLTKAHFSNGVSVSEGEMGGESFTDQSVLEWDGEWSELSSTLSSFSIDNSIEVFNV